MLEYIGSINIRKDRDQVVLTVDVKKSKFDELEGSGFDLKDALEDLLAQVEDLSA